MPKGKLISKDRFSKGFVHYYIILEFYKNKDIKITEKMKENITPTINAYWRRESGNWLSRVKVTNNDTETATIYAGKSTSPTKSFGDLAGGATTTITIGVIPFQPASEATFTAYVQMKATGRNDSDIVSDESLGFGSI